MIVSTSLVAGCGTDGQFTVRAVGAEAVMPVGDLLAQGRTDFALGNVALALDRFRRAERLQPNNVSALNGIAACYDRMGRYDVSRLYYEKALAVAPTDPKTLHNFALSLTMQGRKDEALALARSAAQPEPQAQPVTVPSEVVASASGPEGVTMELPPVQAPAAPQVQPKRAEPSVAVATALPERTLPGPHLERLSLGEVELVTTTTTKERQAAVTKRHPAERVVQVAEAKLVKQTRTGSEWVFPEQVKASAPAGAKVATRTKVVSPAPVEAQAIGKSVTPTPAAAPIRVALASAVIEPMVERLAPIPAQQPAAAAPTEPRPAAQAPVAISEALPTRVAATTIAPPLAPVADPAAEPVAPARPAAPVPVILASAVVEPVGERPVPVAASQPAAAAAPEPRPAPQPLVATSPAAAPRKPAPTVAKAPVTTPKPEAQPKAKAVMSARPVAPAPVVLVSAGVHRTAQTAAPVGAPKVAPLVQPRPAAKPLVMASGAPLRKATAPRVHVLNAVGRKGLAGRYSRYLKARGWAELRTADARRPRSVTVIFYPVGARTQAAALAKRLPFRATLAASNRRDSELMLLLGNNALAFDNRLRLRSQRT
jgi:hypothetical protein